MSNNGNIILSLYDVETFKRTYPGWFQPLDIKDAIFGFSIFVILIFIIYFVCERINKELKEIKNREQKENDENNLIYEYELIYGQRIDWNYEIKEEFDKKWNEIQEKYNL